jgi:hypothetical protein
MIIEKASTKSSKTNHKLSPALTDDAEELQMISLARTLSMERMKNGTATAQEILYWLKLGSSETRLDKEIQQEKKEWLKARTKEIKDGEATAKIYSEAIEAMKSYQGIIDDDGSEENSDIF